MKGFKCPECDAAPFKTNAALGSHRSRVHGVAGTSKATLGKKKGKKGMLSGRTSLIEAVLVLEMENKAEARVIQRLKEMVNV